MTEKAQKRKRDHNASSKPSKRVAIDGDKQVTVCLQRAGKWAPVVASSCGLTTPASISLQPFTSQRIPAFRGPGQTSITATELLLHSSEHHKLDYTAREEQSEGPESLLKHYVGVYDPKTGKLEVLEARKMSVRGTVRSHEAAPEDLGNVNMMRELRNDLGQTFGTKKSKKTIAALTENAITPGGPYRAHDSKPMKLDSVAKAMIENIGEVTAGMSTREQLAEASEAAKPRPKHNVDAENVKDVYTVDSLVGESIMAAVPVRKWLDALKAKEAILTDSCFVSNRLVKVGDSVEKLKILRYMYLMLQILKKSKPLRAGAKMLPKRDDMKAIVDGMPESVVDNFKRKFADKGEISKFKVDLLITHLCALAFIIDNYEVEMWDLQEDLQLETKQMSQYFMEIGAKITALGELQKRRLGDNKAAIAQHRMAKLKLPLQFPRVAFARGRR